MAPHILAVLIFVVMFVLIVMDKIERQYVSLGCGLLMIVLVFGLGMHSKDAIVETLNVKSIFQASFWYTAAEGEASSSGINWSTIIFILGMMIMVEGMGKAGFFRWLCLEIAKLVKYRTIPVFITFMLMSFVLAMFIDSITVILFLAAVTLELAQTLKCNPWFRLFCRKFSVRTLAVRQRCVETRPTLSSAHPWDIPSVNLFPTPALSL